MLKENIDDSVKPGNDFYLYASGKWLASNPIPPHESRWGTFNVLREEIDKKVKSLIESTNEKLIRDFYQSGMDEKKSDKAAKIEIDKIYKKIDGIKNIDDLVESIAILHSKGIYILWFNYVDVDEKNSNQYILRFNQGGLGLPDRDYYLQDDPKLKSTRELYGQHLPKIYSFFMDEKEAAAAALPIITIEQTLAENSDTRVQGRDIERNYNKYTPEQLANLAPNINWRKYFSVLGIELPDQLLVNQPAFLAAVDKLLNQKPIDELKNYLKWHVLLQMYPVLGENFEKIHFEFFGKILSGTLELEPRWQRMTSIMAEMIGEALGKLFVDKYFPEKARIKMEQLVEDLRSAFADRITNLDWMNDNTKKYAIEKLQRVTVKIGHPKTWRDYSSVETTPESLVQNAMNAAEFEIKRNLNKLKQPVDKGEWFMNSYTVNAYANFNMNEIVFPAGILQPPFFDFEADDAINYGGIGTVIGHELTHGFDDMGSQYDAEGNLRNWRTDQDRENFVKRAQVMVKQADNFKVLGEKTINGQLTLGENIADLGGVEIGFDALKKAWARNGKPDLIEGFTPEQRFFLNYARTEAGLYREEQLLRQLTTDPHSPGIFRVNGILKNITAFHSAFKIASDETMFLPNDSQAKIW